MESVGRIFLVYLEGTLSSKMFPPQKAGYFESEMFSPWEKCRVSWET
jgi:hypothetical protein